jgi:hypothetical protein
MRDAADDSVAQTVQAKYQAENQDRNGAYRAVVADLVSLAERVQKSLHLIEQTIAGETPLGSPESSTNMIVLHDVSPRYVRAAAAVHACDVNLAIALRSLLDLGDDGRLTDRSAPSSSGRKAGTARPAGACSAENS